MGKFSGKVAVVTGASKGIGAAIALEFARQGAEVVVNYSSSKEGAQKVVHEITQEGGKAIALHANMSKASEIEGLFIETIKAFGRVDVLINNAGVYEFASIEKVTLDHYHKIFDLNVMGLLLTIREAVKHFKESGSIVNISSVVSTSSLPNGAVYSASKAAVDAITRSLGKELGPRNIRVNSVDPGLVETEGTNNAGVLESSLRKNTELQTPLGRIGKPQDIAPAVAFLASDDASWITGETLFISGGFR